MRVIIGAGFSCPAACSLVPDEAYLPVEDPKVLEKSEQSVLDVVNRLLEDCAASPCGELLDLYTDAAVTLLMTYPELDAYSVRPDTPYLGILPTAEGAQWTWPPSQGKRIFAYLRPVAVLAVDLQSGGPVGAADGDLLPRLDREDPSTLHQRFGLVPDRTGRRRGGAAETCDLFVSNGSHAMTAEMLLAGKPSLMLPIDLEKRAEPPPASTAMGAGKMAPPDDARRTLTALRELAVGREVSRRRGAVRRSISKRRPGRPGR